MLVTVHAYGAGRLSAGGPGMSTVHRRISHATTTTLRVPLSRRGRGALASRSKLRTKLRVGFVPTLGAEGISAAFATIVFRR